jgi:hypothetical protein
MNFRKVWLWEVLLNLMTFQFSLKLDDVYENLTNGAACIMSITD